MYSFRSFLCFSPLIVCGGCGSGKDEEPSGANVLRLIQIRLATPSLRKSRQLGKTIGIIQSMNDV